MPSNKSNDMSDTQHNQSMQIRTVHSDKDLYNGKGKAKGKGGLPHNNSGSRHSLSMTPSLPHAGSGNFSGKRLVPHEGSGSNLLPPRQGSKNSVGSAGKGNKENSRPSVGEVTSPRMLLPIPPMVHSTSGGLSSGVDAIQTPKNTISPRTPGSATRKNKRYGILLETPTKKSSPRDGSFSPGGQRGFKSGRTTPGSDTRLDPRTPPPGTPPFNTGGYPMTPPPGGRSISMKNQRFMNSPKHRSSQESVESPSVVVHTGGFGSMCGIVVDKKYQYFFDIAIGIAILNFLMSLDSDVYSLALSTSLVAVAFLVRQQGLKNKDRAAKTPRILLNEAGAGGRTPTPSSRSRSPAVQKRIDGSPAPSDRSAGRRSPSNRLRSNIFDAANRGDGATAEKYLLEIVEQGGKPDSATCTIVMKAYAEKEDVDSCERVLQWMHEIGVRAQLNFINSLVTLHANKGKLDRAEYLLTRMNEAGSQPNYRSFWLLAKNAHNVGDSEMVNRVFKTMVDAGFGAGLVNYCRVTAIEGLSKASHEDVQAMYADLISMMENGDRPDIGTIHVAVKAFVVRGDADAVDHILNLTKEMNCANFDVMLFSMWINVHSENGNIERGEQILNMMKENGVAPNVRTYTTLMKAYIAQKDIASAERLLHTMMDNKVKPDVVTFNSLIHAYTVAGQCEKAESFFAEMMAHGVWPDNLSFHFLRKTYNRKGDRKGLSRLQAIQNEAVARGATIGKGQAKGAIKGARLNLPNDGRPPTSPHYVRQGSGGKGKGRGKGGHKGGSVTPDVQKTPMGTPRSAVSGF